MFGGRPLGPDESTWAEQAELFRRAVEPCLEPAREAGVALMIENAPQPYSDSHIGRLQATRRAADNVSVLLDSLGV